MGTKSVIFLAVSMWSILAGAMTTHQVELTCPYDGTKFSKNLQSSGTSYDATLDLQPVGAIVTPWPLAVCPTDGFVFFKSKFENDELAKLRPFVQSDEYQALRAESAYYRAAWLLDHLGATHWEVTWTLIQATWEKRQYINKVVERLLDDIAGASGEEEINRRLLLGEFLRQLGRFPEAEQAFLSVLEKTDPFSHLGLIARYELSLVSSKDKWAGHRQSEAIRMFEKDPDYRQASQIPTVSETSHLQQHIVYKPEGLESVWKGPNSMVWSDDGSTIFASTDKGVAAIKSGQGDSFQSPPISACQDCSRNGFQVLLSTADSLFVSQRHPRSMKRLDTSSLNVTASYEFKDLLEPALLSFDRNSMIYDIGTGVEQRDLQTNETVALGQPPGVARRGLESWYLKATDPSGARLAFYHGRTSEKPTVVLWDYAKNTNVLELPTDQFDRLSPNAEVAFSPDGSRLYVANNVHGNDKTEKKQCDLSVWNLPSGELMTRRMMEGGGSRLSVSSDGRYVAMACGKAVSLWSSDLEQHTATLKIRGNGWFPSIAFDPKSQSFAVHTGAAIVIYKIGN